MRTGLSQDHQVTNLLTHQQVQAVSGSGQSEPGLSPCQAFIASIHFGPSGLLESGLAVVATVMQQSCVLSAMLMWIRLEVEPRYLQP